MKKEKIKFPIIIVLSIVLATISVIGLAACFGGKDKSTPKSFVCAETNLTIELSKDNKHYIVTDCPENKTELVIPDSYYGKPVKEIGEAAFDGCESLTKISIPDCMININTKALFDCKSLEYTEAGEVKYLGNENNPYVYLVKYLSKDIESVVVESSCKAIGNSAFYDCGKLKSVSFPEGLTSIGKAAFGYCTFYKR